MSARDDYPTLDNMTRFGWVGTVTAEEIRDALYTIDRLRALHRASCEGCPRMPQCWEAANLSVKEPSSSRPPDVASGPASPQVKA